MITSFDDSELRIYQELRQRLVDRTRRNRLLHFDHDSRSPSLRFVDSAPDEVLGLLRDDRRLEFSALPELDDDLPDEKTPRFQAALLGARSTDQDYSNTLAKLDLQHPSDARKRHRIEQELRNRVRAELSLPPRPSQSSLDLAAYARAHGIDPEYDIAPSRQPRAPRDALQTLLFRKELNAGVTKLARNARSIEQETGVGTLHLAFGFLEWFESEESEEAFCSPLLLLPVSIQREKVPGREEEFRLASVDSIPATNLSLELRLRDDFRLTLPQFSLEADEPAEHYFKAIAEALRSHKRWCVRRFVTLAPFSFTRIAMYKDLDPVHWAGIGNPADHRLVRPILRGIGDDAPPLGASYAREYEIDRPEVAQLAPVLVHDADSSQHSAMIDAMQGKNLVIEGPPGTGKSQTIANLIANIIFRGQTVLFVSEKMAALEAVKSRLDQVGLERFCLTLHAGEARPAAIIEALRREVDRREEAGCADGGLAPLSGIEAERARSELKKHIEALHQGAGPRGETVHALIGRLAELRRLLPHLPDLLRPFAHHLSFSIDAPKYSAAREKLEALQNAANSPERLGWNPATSPFSVLERADLLPDEQADLLAALRNTGTCCDNVMECLHDLSEAIGESRPGSLASAHPILERLGQLPDPGELVDRTLLSRFTHPSTIEDGFWTACRLEAVENTFLKLNEAGVQDPAGARADYLQAVVEFAGPLGLADCSIEDISGRVQAAVSDRDVLNSQGKLVDLLATTLSLGRDPDAGLIRLACSAAELAADPQLRWPTYRKAGLEHYRNILEAAAMRQKSIEAKLKEITNRLDVDGASEQNLRIASASLRETGIFAGRRPEVKEAVKFFRTRWRAGELPPRAQWASCLEDAAQVIRELQELNADPEIRHVLDGYGDQAGLSELAEVARWQCRVMDQISGERIEAAQIRAALVLMNPSDLHSLSLLAEPARVLRVHLDRMGVTDSQPWSALCKAQARRVEAMDRLSTLLASSNLSKGLPIAAIAPIAEALIEWHRAVAELNSPRAQRLLLGSSPKAPSFRATLDFAANIFRAAEASAPALLSDGWTGAIAALRESAQRAGQALPELGAALQLLSALGLRSFASRAETRPLAGLRSEIMRLLSAQDELPAYLKFATVRADCKADALARPVVEAFETSSKPLQNLPEALDWLIAWSTVRRRAEADRPLFTRTG
ncbi:MAG: DUF4011 domain-containing protein, partial [Acetobacteraceae bacterium]|nr:DUF4011 domain-containing protein [Acetobacteraceae bacterium]